MRPAPSCSTYIIFCRLILIDKNIERLHIEFSGKADIIIGCIVEGIRVGHFNKS
jgi:hypothetical protein